GYLVDGTLKTDTVNLATIAIACAVGYLNFRRVAPGWCVDHSLSIIDYILTHLAPKHPKYCRINLTKKQEEIDFCYKKR
ncbi:hypothetical protein ACVWBN_22685, partial [Escherichia coli]